MWLVKHDMNPSLPLLNSYSSISFFVPTIFCLLVVRRTWKMIEMVQCPAFCSPRRSLRLMELSRAPICHERHKIIAKPGVTPMSTLVIRRVSIERVFKVQIWNAAQRFISIHPSIYVIHAIWIARRFVLAYRWIISNLSLGSYNPAIWHARMLYCDHRLVTVSGSLANSHHYTFSSLSLFERKSAETNFIPSF